jgi:hypothetical protein
MLIAYRDAVANSTLQASGFGNTAAPIDNIKDRRLAKIARATSTGPLFIESYFDGLYDIKIIAILAHNIPAGANVEFALIDYDSNVLFTETYTNLWAPPINSLFPRHTYFIMTAVVEDVASLNISISNQGSTLVEIGRLWLSNAFAPVGKAASAGFTVNTMDDTTVNKSEGQQVYVDYRSRYRRMSVSIPYMEESEAIGVEAGTTVNLQDVAFEVGRGGEVIVIPTQSSNQAIHKFGVYGHFAEAPGVELRDINSEMGRLYSSSFDVVEDL